MISTRDMCDLCDELAVNTHDDDGHLCREHRAAVQRAVTSASKPRPAPTVAQSCETVRPGQLKGAA